MNKICALQGELMLLQWLFHLVLFDILVAHQLYILVHIFFFDNLLLFVSTKVTDKLTN